MADRTGKARLMLVLAITAAIGSIVVGGPKPEDGAGSGQGPRVSIEPTMSASLRHTEGRDNIRADVKVVLVPVRVSDAMDHPVTGLKPDAFRLFEDGVEQKIASFSNEEGPVSIGFLFDASSSMKKSMATSTGAVKQFMQSAMPGDEFFLIRFSDRPTLVRRFTSDPEAIVSDLSYVRAEGWTALLDAMYLGANVMKSARNARKILVVLSDGGDNNSRYTESEVKHLLVESDIRVYSIGLFDRPKFLAKMAAITGGQSFWAHHLNELPDVIDRLSHEFRSQYVLGYSPANPGNDGKYRTVRIELVQHLSSKELNLFWRRGYIAPD